MITSTTVLINSALKPRVLWLFCAVCYNPDSNGVKQKPLERHCGLEQVVLQLSRGTSTLDLIFTNMVDCYNTPQILAPLSTSDHNIINWKSKYHIAEKGNTIKVKVRKIQLQQSEDFLL
jgi:hypothetical protein